MSIVHHAILMPHGVGLLPCPMMPPSSRITEESMPCSLSIRTQPDSSERCFASTRCRPAALDGAHHLHLPKAHVTAVGMTPRGPVGAEDIRDLKSWTGHVCRRLLRRRLGPRPQRRQAIEWAHDRADRVGCAQSARLRHDPRIERRRVELGVPQQNLNDANINVLLEQMRGKAVP